jgi:hypothetical protein
VADDFVESDGNQTKRSTIKQVGTGDKPKPFQRVVDFFDNWNKIFGAVVGFIGIATVLWAGVAHLDHSGPTRPAGTSSTATLQYVVTPESCAASYSVEGQAGPLLCPDGRPSRAVDNWYRQARLKLFSLGPNASPNEVIAAICSDLSSNPMVNALPSEKVQIEIGAVKLWETEEKWDSALIPDGDISVVQTVCPNALRPVAAKN